MKKTIIIGGVAAGASCAARLRRLDEERQIILLERGSYISYANCGLPYYVGDVIHEKSSLLVTDADTMRARFHIDVRTETEALAIHPEEKTVEIIDHKTGKRYTETYDDLVLASGSAPFRPRIEGIDSPLVHTLWTVPDAEEIRQLAEQSHSAAVVGGGFIGVEIAENLKAAGLEVTIIEGADQVLPPLDREMAALVEEELVHQGVHLVLKAPVQKFTEAEEDGKKKIEVQAEGHIVRADFAVLSIGVRPNTSLAKEAGIQLNERGFVVTDAHMRTSIPSIYAAGDIVETEDAVTGLKASYALAGPANKQGRIAADNIAGYEDTYKGSQGTSIAKVFDLSAGMSGQSEKACLRRGMVKGKDFATAYVSQNSHAGYYPGAAPMMIKLVYVPHGRILGTQIVGYDGVDKRIDTLAEAIRLKADAADLADLEFAYAPPYSAAKDPVNMMGFTVRNMDDGLVKFSDWDVLEKRTDLQVLDVREQEERDAFAIPGAIGIALGNLRNHIEELDPGKPTLIFCAAGIRAYNAARILSQHGFADVMVYPGGCRFYRSTHYMMFQQETGRIKQKTEPDSLAVQAETCTQVFQETIARMRQMKHGDSLQIRMADPLLRRELAAWGEKEGYAVDEEKELLKIRRR